MRRLLVLVVVAMVSASCASAAHSPGPSEPSPTTTVGHTPAPTASAPACPIAAPMTVDQYLAADPACFGSRDVTLAGWEDVPNYAGNLPTPPIAPAWLVEPAPSILESHLPPAPCDATTTPCPWLDVRVDPASGLTFERDGRWVIVTGHRGDPTAETCVYAPPAVDAPSPPPSRDVVRATCNRSFVLTSVTPAPSPAGALAFCPSEAVITVATYQATDPACFHGKTVQIVGYVAEIPAMGFHGPTLVPSWLLYPASVVWSVPPVVTEGNGSCPDHSPDGMGTCSSMFVMRDPHGGVPDPAEHRWVIFTGHIDDPVSDTCYYADGGPFGDPPPPAAYARQDCRRALVITKVAYTTEPSPSP